jgi:NADH-quinone oxidoreductase subunit G
MSGGAPQPGTGTARSAETPAAPPAPDEQTLTFTIDGRTAVARQGELVIAAAERAGTFIPRFCYHPRMRPVGMCRMCLVEISGPRGATLQPACFIEAQQDMEVVTTSEKVKKAQDGVLEFLLVNHPLDCPVCDKGGECPLQDQTLAYGPGETRFVEEKRHFEKPIALSELVLLDRERCIQCSRCTRFADEVAGEAQIDFHGRGERLEVNTFFDRPFASYFSGNTVQICPVGALTATPYRFTARPWDLDQVESTCVTCAFGCRAAVQSSANRVTRLLGIDADPVNQSWLCDKGRFAYESTNAPDRITEPLVRKDGRLVAASWHEALTAAADGLRGRGGATMGADVGVIGGARLTNEGAYAWARLAKGLLGTDSVDAQLGDGLPAEVVLGLPPATIDQAANAATLVLLGGDVREELPVLFLRLRGAATGGATSILELSPRATSLTPHAAVSLRYLPGEAADLVRRLTGGAAGAGDQGAESDAELAAARTLLDADDVVVVAGRPSLAEDGELVADALCALAAARPTARFLFGLRRGNVRGALDMGLAPGLLPGRVALEDGRDWFRDAWGGVPEARGLDTGGMLASAAGDGPVKALVLLGAEPLSDFPDRRLARRGLEGARFVVAVTSQPGEECELADVILPAAEAHERRGTTTNIEGRISRLGHKLVAPGQAWPDWMIASELAVHLGTDLGLDSLAAVWAEIERLAPSHAGITPAVLDAPGAADGVIAPLTGTPESLAHRAPPPIDPIAIPGVESVERQGAPPRAGLAELPEAIEEPGSPSGRAAIASGGTSPAGGGPSRPAVLSAPGARTPPHVPPTDNYSMRLLVVRTLYDQGSAVTGSAALAALVQPATLRVNPADLDDLGVSAGDRVRIRTADAETVIAVAPDASLPRRVVATEFNVPFGSGADDEAAPVEGTVQTVADLIDVGRPVVELRLESR